MARLPTPGGDVGDWGDILNTFLRVSHATDGTLNASVVDTSQIKNGAVTNAKLDSTTQSALAAAYQKPVGGIPESDLASSLQTKIDAGGTAYQKPGTGIPEADLSSATQSKIDAGNTAYQKPGTGIPKTDLASSVQTSLSNADSAVQTVNSKNPTAGDVTLSKSDVGLSNVDNTSDASKPVSTATQTALNTKLTASSNLSDLGSASSARTNLGLGGAATLNVGATNGTVAAGDDSRLVGALQAKEQTTAPSSPASNDLWYDSTNDLLKRWNGSAWIVAGASSFAPIMTMGTAVSTSGALAINTQSYCSAAGGNLTMTLPTSQTAGTRIIATKSESSTNTVTVTGNIQGIASQSYVLSLVGQTVQFEADSSGSWWPISSRYDLSTLDSRYQLAGSAVGSSLAYSQLATGVGGIATNTTFVDITGMPLTISPVLGTRAVEIQARLVLQPAAATTVSVAIFDATASAIIANSATTVSTASGFVTIYVSIQVTPGAGTRTYRPQISTTSSTACNVYGSNVNNLISYISAIQR
ncbi:MAG TPA: hypothetical protein VG992_01890 [Candidatus Saccharimonadales bacterium]|nr:hypothetical protein [Candidatus Saccharimonadales bacterium]